MWSLHVRRLDKFVVQQETKYQRFTILFSRQRNSLYDITYVQSNLKTYSHSDLTVEEFRLKQTYRKHNSYIQSKERFKVYLS